MMTEGNIHRVVDDDGMSSNGNSSSSPTKRGHKLCGVCCDVRRAVIIINIVRSSITAYGMLAIFIMEYMLSHESAADLNIDDDAAISAWSQLQQNGVHVGAIMFLSFLTIVASIIGIYGAMKFNIIFVAISALALGIDIIVALVKFAVVPLLFALFLLYPHVMFIKEVRDGTMTAETYATTERYSCCCISKNVSTSGQAMHEMSVVSATGTAGDSKAEIV